MKLKVFVGSLWTMLVGVFTLFAYRANRLKWTKESLRTVYDNMGDQVAIKNSLTLINLELLGIIVLAIILVIGAWYLLFKARPNNSKKGSMPMSMLFVLLFGSVFLTGCGTEYVTVTPPNYAVVISMDAPTNQATGNDFSNANLVNVTQIRVNRPLCAPLSGSSTRCPDKIIAEVPGAPQSRAYTKDPNTGTSGADEAICFEASGVNGCVDFSVSAVVLREDAACYASKVGVFPVNETNYHYAALPLSEALDTRMIQIASSNMVLATAEMNPLELATTKFTVFDGVKQTIIDEVHSQTCITINQLDLSGGIQWDSVAVQETIDDAIVLQNEIMLAKKQQELQDQEVLNLKRKFDAYIEAYGEETAKLLITLDYWDGSFMPSSWIDEVVSSPVETVATTENPGIEETNP